MRDAACWKSVVVAAGVAAILLAAIPAPAAARQAAAGVCPEAQRCLDLLGDGIALIEAGRWDAASVLLEEAATGLEGRQSYARDLALAYVYLGVARLQVADADETRQWFAEARLRDPTLELGTEEFPRDVLEIWGEARELGVLLVESEPAGAQVSVDRVVQDRPDEPDGVSTSTRLGAAASAAPSDLLATAQRFAPDTTKLQRRSLWRTLIGIVGIVGGAAIAGRECGVSGGERGGNGAPVEALGGTLMARSFVPSPQHESSEGWIRWWGSCRLSYSWVFEDGRGRTSGGQVDDHEALLRQSSSGAASFEDQLHRGLAESVGAARAELFFPRDRLAGGLVVAGLGALLATIWSDGGIVVEEVALSVTPAGGVLASRSFGW